jgi:hypothetical protein
VRSGRPLPLPAEALQGRRGRAAPPVPGGLPGAPGPRRGPPARLPRDGTSDGEPDLSPVPSWRSRRAQWRGTPCALSAACCQHVQLPHVQLRGAREAAPCSALLRMDRTPALPDGRSHVHECNFRLGQTWRLGMPVPFAYSGAAPQARGGDCAEGFGGAGCRLALVPRVADRCETTGSHFTLCDPVGGACCWGSSPCWP